MKHVQTSEEWQSSPLPCGFHHAICVISSALVFYTIGVWGERLQKKLKLWHIIFFLLGLVSDAVGTSLMEHIAELANEEKT